MPVTAKNQKFELYVTWPGNKQLSKTVSAYVLHRNNRNRWDYLINNIKFSQSTSPSGTDYGGVKWKKIGSPFVLHPNKRTRVYLLAPKSQKMTVDAVMLRPVTNCGNEEKEAGEDCDDGNDDPNDGCHKCRYKCFDSDGKDKTSAGYVIVMNKDGEMIREPDKCDDDEVVERICVKNKPEVYVFNCEYMCKEGACIKTEAGKVIHKVGPNQGNKAGPNVEFGIEDIINLPYRAEVLISDKKSITQSDKVITIPID